MRLLRLSTLKLVLAIVGGIGAAAYAQTAQGMPAPPITVADKLASLTSRAATVFTGQVCAIERHGGVVEITFCVEQPVLGLPGSRYVLREWAGFWPPGQFRYTVGERALVFLHGVSPAGFASPVDGAEGVVPVIVGGVNAPQLLDVRRLDAAVLRVPGAPLPSEADGAIQLTEAVFLINEVVRAASMGHARGLTAPWRLPVGRLPIRRSGTPLRAPQAEETFSPEPLQIERRGNFANRVLAPVAEVSHED